MVQGKSNWNAAPSVWSKSMRGNVTSEERKRGRIFGGSTGKRKQLKDRPQMSLSRANIRGEDSLENAELVLMMAWNACAQAEQYLGNPHASHYMCLTDPLKRIQWLHFHKTTSKMCDVHFIRTKLYSKLLVLERLMINPFTAKTTAQGNRSKWWYDSIIRYFTLSKGNLTEPK